MKKILLLLVVVVLGLGIVTYTQMNSIVKVGIETGGPKALQVPVSVGSISLAPFSGKVSLTDLSVGQPVGFGEGEIATLGALSLKLEPKSLLSDHIIIDSLVIDTPKLDARVIDGKNNFKALQDRLAAGSDAKSDTTLTIRELVVKAPTVTVSTEGAVDIDKTITLADFTLTDLGTDEVGLAPREIARHVMAVLEPQIAKALIKAGASAKLKELAGDTGEKLEKGLGGLLEKLDKKKKTEPDPE